MSEEKLKACPFCGSSQYRIDENNYWTGTRNQLISVCIRHWCDIAVGMPRISIDCTAKTKDEAIETINKRIVACEDIASES